MSASKSPASASNEAGFALIEVLVSGLIAILVAAAVMTLFGATERSAADQRRKSQAYGVAQDDQTRMRSLRVPTLNKYSATNTVTVDGTPYSVESTAKFINNNTGDDLTCGSGKSTVDFVKITSKVTWSGMGPDAPVILQSLIAPPSGTLNPAAGTLVFMASNAAGTPTAGVGVSGSGAGTFTGSTSSSGCIIFLEQAAGEYTLALTGLANGLVDQDGNAPAAQKIKVSPEVTNTVNLLFDKPGSVPVKFTTRNYSSTPSAASTETFLAYNTGMSTAKLFGTIEGTAFSSKTATPLFPFTSPDSFYAGACTDNNPETGTGIVNVTVPAGGTAAEQTIVLPSLWLTVKSDGVIDNGAEVKITDTECESGGHGIRRTYSTNSSGHLPNPGLPWSTYTVCASDEVEISKSKKGVITYGTVHETLPEGIEVHSVNGTSKEIALTSADESGGCEWPS